VADDPELLDLFDRFLRLVGDATRRFVDLFPYNHLFRHLQRILDGGGARVIVTDDEGGPAAALHVRWRDGEFRRTAPTQPIKLAWSVPRARLEHAAAQPWVYLADPKRLGFAWFCVGSDSSVPSRRHRMHTVPSLHTARRPRS
jgi:hypothetical protein